MFAHFHAVGKDRPNMNDKIGDGWSHKCHTEGTDKMLLVHRGCALALGSSKLQLISEQR